VTTQAGPRGRARRRDPAELYEDPEASARLARLRHVDATEDGIRRRRCGRGFSYRHPSGRPLSAADRARITSLAIPPAWQDVWICTDPDGHLQATGVDDRGRKQYLYHARWRAVRDLLNFSRLVEVGKALPPVRAHVAAQLRRRHLDRDRVIAGVIALLDRCHARIGGEQYAEENESFGLTTLRPEHVRVSGSRTTLCFPAKSGQQWSCTVEDAPLARLLRALCRRRGSDRVFAVDGAPITADDVNAVLCELAGGHLTAKDFRTWGGTLAAFRHLRGLPGGDPSDADLVAAVDAAAQLLGNTRAVARSAYVDPRVLAAHRADEPRLRARVRPGKGLTDDETALMRLLEALLDSEPLAA
jgi:DNA topoisomerase-1